MEGWSRELAGTAVKVQRSSFPPAVDGLEFSILSAEMKIEV